MHKTKIYIILIISLSLFACGKESKAQDSINDWEEKLFSNNQEYKNIDLNIVAQKINRALQKAPMISKNRFDQVEIKFSDGDFEMVQNTDETILMTEGVLDKSIAVGKNRYRTRAYYTIKDAQIKQKNPKMKIPVPIKEIIEEFSGPEYIPAHITTTLAEKISDALIDNDKMEHYTNHSTAITDILLEYNPHSPIVFLEGITDLHRFYDKNILCTERLNRIKKHINDRNQTFTKDLKDLFKRDKIHYINMSFGINKRDISGDLNELCPHTSYYKRKKIADIYLDELNDIFKTLHESKGIISFQASPYQFMDEGPHDCKKKYKNRIMVGSFNYINAPIGVSGQELSKLNKSNMYKQGKCADVYVNFNLDPENKVDYKSTLMSTYEFGFGMTRMGRMPSVSTSNATPLALSRVIHLRHSKRFQHRIFDNTLIKDLKESLTPKLCGTFFSNKRCDFIDPLKHRQAQVFELGYW